MRAAGQLSHTLGGTLGVRLRNAGYLWQVCSENIAWDRWSAAATIQDWVASPPHRHNMLNVIYTEAGMGRSDDYWCLVLARPLGAL